MEWSVTAKEIANVDKDLPVNIRSTFLCTKAQLEAMSNTTGVIK